MRNRWLLAVGTSATLCSACAAQNGQMAADRLTSVLQQRLPPVVIHHAQDGPVAIQSISGFDAQAEASAPAPRIEVLGAAAVLRGDQVLRLEEGAAVQEGDLVILALLRNAGEDSARITLRVGPGTPVPAESPKGAVIFAGSTNRVILDPEETLFLGPQMVLQATHCYTCECRCDVTEPGQDCSMTIANEATADCSVHMGVSCGCEDGGRGTTTDCEKVILPCGGLAAIPFL